jgi:ferredoxin--NADP+ reductase
VVTRYLATKPQGNHSKVVLDKLKTILNDRKSHPVDVKNLRALEAAEKAHKSATDCIGEFKYASNQEMIELIKRG